MPATVRDVMSFPVHVVTPSTPFRDAAAQLDRHRVSALPVVDGDGRLVGIVSEADLLIKEEAALEERRSLLEPRGRRRRRTKAAALTVHQLMTSPVVSVAPTATVAYAARLMRERHVKRLPVLDDEGRIVGIVSRGDLLKVYLREDDDIRREILGAMARTWPEGTGATVTVRGANVTLEGTVDRRSDVETLVRLAAETAGVVAVESRLSYRNDDQAVGVPVPEPWPSYGITGRSRGD